MGSTELTILNEYRLTGAADEFVEAISRLAKRVHAEGHPGILSYRFFVNGSEGMARAVIDYRNASAWIGHHDIAMEWPEMKAMHAVATLENVTFLGTLTKEIQDWIDGSSLQVRIGAGNEFAAGFRR